MAGSWPPLPPLRIPHGPWVPALRDQSRSDCLKWPRSLDCLEGAGSLLGLGPDLAAAGIPASALEDCAELLWLDLVSRLLNWGTRELRAARERRQPSWRTPVPGAAARQRPPWVEYTETCCISQRVPSHVSVVQWGSASFPACACQAELCSCQTARLSPACTAEARGRPVSSENC